MVGNLYIYIYIYTYPYSCDISNVFSHIYYNNTQLVCSGPGRRGAQEHQGPVPPRAGSAGHQRFRCGGEGLQANPGTGPRQQGPSFGSDTAVGHVLYITLQHYTKYMIT